MNCWLEILKHFKGMKGGCYFSTYHWGCFTIVILANVFSCIYTDVVMVQEASVERICSNFFNSWHNILICLMYFVQYQLLESSV